MALYIRLKQYSIDSAAINQTFFELVLAAMYR